MRKQAYHHGMTTRVGTSQVVVDCVIIYGCRQTRRVSGGIICKRLIIAVVISLIAISPRDDGREASSSDTDHDVTHRNPLEGPWQLKTCIRL